MNLKELVTTIDACRFPFSVPAYLARTKFPAVSTRAVRRSARRVRAPALQAAQGILAASPATLLVAPDRAPTELFFPVALLARETGGRADCLPCAT